MLEQVLDYIHNYFVKAVHTGKITISDGRINVDGIQDGQYYKIIGSIFNDGLYKYGDSTRVLHDEEFVGEIWLMAVPPALIDIAAEVKSWVDKYGNVVASPYTSESFGGYSYTKVQNSTASNSKGLSWQTAFGSRLNHWRKIS